MKNFKRKLTSSVPLKETDVQKKNGVTTKFRKVPPKDYWEFDFGDPSIWCDDLWGRQQAREFSENSQ